MRYLNIRCRILRSSLLSFIVGCQLVAVPAFAQWQGDRGGREDRYRERLERRFDLPRFSPETQRTSEMEEQRASRRLSQEERRQLRRDIHDAGRDIYGERPRRF